MRADTIDTENELAQERIDQAVARLRINRNAVSAEYCSECGEGIPQQRRVAVPGYKMSAECQNTTEKRNKHRR